MVQEPAGACDSSITVTSEPSTATMTRPFATTRMSTTEPFPPGLSFFDMDNTPGVIAGTITITRAADESIITGYSVYFGSTASERLRLPGVSVEYFTASDGRASFLSPSEPARLATMVDAGWEAIGPEGVAVRWSGEVEISTAGVYYLKLSASNVTMLHVDGALRLTSAGPRAVDSGSANLTAGRHTIRLDCLTSGGFNDWVALEYSGSDTGGNFMPIPQAVLTHGEDLQLASVSSSRRGNPLLVPVARIAKPANAQKLLLFAEGLNGSAWQLASWPLVETPLPQ